MSQWINKIKKEWISEYMKKIQELRIIEWVTEKKVK